MKRHPGRPRPWPLPTKYHGRRNNQSKNVRYRLISASVRARLAAEKQTQGPTTKVAVGHWIPVQRLP